MKRAALYIRVSHEEQALHGLSVRSQRQNLQEYAAKHNYFVVDEYVDEGISGRKRFNKRTEFVRLLNDIQQDKIDIILFINIERWFRNVADYYKIQEILDRHNVVWKTTTENYDTETANGRLHLNIKLSISQDEADRTSERIKFVFEDKVRRGEAIGGSLPYGLKITNKKVVPDPDKVPIVKDLFDHYLTCQGKRTTLAYAINKYNLYLPHNTFSRMLKNPLYVGEYRGNSNYCKPIIDRETYNRIQETIKKNIKQTKTRTTYVFTGLLICPECGHNLASAKTKTSENTYNHHYRCNFHYMHRKCSFNRMIGEKKIEAFLLENIEFKVKKCIARYDLIERKAAQQVSKSSEIEKVKKKLNRLKDLYLDELIDKESYRKEFNSLSDKLKELSQENKVPKRRINIEALQKFLQMNITKVYSTLSREEKQLLWRNVIREIRFDPVTLKPSIFFC